MTAQQLERDPKARSLRAAKEERDATIREKARAGGCNLEIYDDAKVEEVDDGYWVSAKIFVPREA